MISRIFSFTATLRFPAFDTPEQERVFWEERDRGRFEFRKFFLLCAILITAAMSSLDVILGGETTSKLLALRAATILSMAYLFYLFIRASTPIGREHIIVAVGVVFVASTAGMTLIGSSEVTRLYPSFFFCSMIFGGSLLVPRFSMQMIFCVIVSIIYWPMALLNTAATGEFFINSFLMLITTLSVAIGSFIREQLEREQALAESRLVAARDEALRAARAKSHLLANVSHELRTPLNAIIGFSEVMENETFGKIPQPQYREYIRDIHYSGKLLHTNINDLLDISRMEVGKMGWTDEDFSLSELLTQVISTCSQTDKGVAVILSDRLRALEVSMRGDPYRISQAFINVINNAVKFSEFGSAVVIDTVDDDDFFGFSITDEGCGIADADFAKILQPFGQAKRSVYDASNNGLGLGLTIVQGIMERCDGLFGISSEVNVGTTVTLLIPSDRVVVVSAEEVDVQGIFRGKSKGRAPMSLTAKAG